MDSMRSREGGKGAVHIDMLRKVDPQVQMEFVKLVKSHWKNPGTEEWDYDVVVSKLILL